MSDKEFNLDDLLPKPDGVVRFRTFDRHLINTSIETEFGTHLSVDFVETADSSEQVLWRLLTKHFPDWKQATWFYRWDFDDTLWAKIILLEVDGEYVEDGDPEDFPHPIWKEIEHDVNQTWLATEGIRGMSRYEYPD